MSNYSSDFGEQDTNTHSYSSPHLDPQHAKDYSLEEYLRLRDTFNSNKNKLPELDAEKSVGMFVFTAKYVLPTILLCLFFNPIAKAMGISGATIFVIASILYLIYKFPSISRAIRKQEAIDLAEMERAEYQAFLKANEKAIKKGKKRQYIG